MIAKETNAGKRITEGPCYHMATIVLVHNMSRDVKMTKLSDVVHRYWGWPIDFELILFTPNIMGLSQTDNLCRMSSVLLLLLNNTLWIFATLTMLIVCLYLCLSACTRVCFIPATAESELFPGRVQFIHVSIDCHLIFHCLEVAVDQSVWPLVFTSHHSFITTGSSELASSTLSWLQVFAREIWGELKSGNPRHDWSF